MKRDQKKYRESDPRVAIVYILAAAVVAWTAIIIWVLFCGNLLTHLIGMC